MVLDDLVPGETVVAGAGYLCDVTTTVGGELNLRLILYRSDDENHTTYLMSGEADYAVEGPVGEE